MNISFSELPSTLLIVERKKLKRLKKPNRFLKRGGHMYTVGTGKINPSKKRSIYLIKFLFLGADPPGIIGFEFDKQADRHTDN